MKNEVEIRNEEILLLGLCRLRFSHELVDKLRKLITPETDWNYFVKLANEHGIPALVFHNLEHIGLLHLLPPESATALRNSLMLNVSRNAFHITVTEEIVGILNKAEVKVVLLKGFALEMTSYGSSGLRQMTDVDILIDRKDYLKARTVLMENGFDSLPVKSGLHKPIIAWTGKHLPSLLRNGASLDIHLELFPGKKNDLTRQLFDTSSEITIDREKAWVPSPQLFFLFLVRHLYSHEIRNESQLRLYTDLVVLIEQYHDEIINYDLISNAEKAGLLQVLAWRLEPLRDLWGISFPDWIDDFIDKWFNPDSINKFVFFLKSPKNNKQKNQGQVYRLTIMEIPGLHRKLLFILGDLFPTLSFMKERYGCSNNFIAFLHYPFRFGKLFWFFRR